jgi:putative ABC transport system ATP-binding protein
MSQPPELLQIRDLLYAWPGASADVLTLPALDLRAGRSYFLHGPSGCGKSTLLGLMAGVLLPRQGRVEFLGQDWACLPPGRRDRRRAQFVGVIFQQFNLLSYLSCLDNVLLPCRLSPVRAERCAGSAQEEARRLLQRMELPSELWQRSAGTLSIGQQQRVAAARALIGRPALVIADEPTSALDEPLREAFMALLMGECREGGSTLVFVSHDERLAAHFDERLSLRALQAVQPLAPVGQPGPQGPQGPPGQLGQGGPMPPRQEAAS